MSLTAASERVRDSFSAESLDALSAACLTAEEFSSFPAALLLIHFVTTELSAVWDDPVPTHHAESLDARFTGPIVAAIDAITHGRRDELDVALAALSVAFVSRNSHAQDGTA